MRVIKIHPQLRSLAAALQGYGMLLAWCFFEPRACCECTKYPLAEKHTYLGHANAD
jgi:hypothetical protein